MSNKQNIAKLIYKTSKEKKNLRRNPYLSNLEEEKERREIEDEP